MSDDENVDRDISATFSPSSQISLSETERLLFAKQLLVVIAIIAVVAGVSYAYNPENKALIAIFDVIKIGVLPLVTLVVAFYFQRSK